MRLCSSLGGSFSRPGPDLERRSISSVSLSGVSSVSLPSSGVYIGDSGLESYPVSDSGAVSLVAAVVTAVTVLAEMLAEAF